MQMQAKTSSMKAAEEHCNSIWTSIDAYA